MSIGIGAQGRDRTTDTAIFNRMLYQLSYLGAKAANMTIGHVRAAARRVIEALSKPVQNRARAKIPQAFRPIAARNRLFSTVPSRSGRTRGGSEASI